MTAPFIAKRGIPTLYRGSGAVRALRRAGLCSLTWPAGAMSMNPLIYTAGFLTSPSLVLHNRGRKAMKKETSYTMRLDSN